MAYAELGYESDSEPPPESTPCALRDAARLADAMRPGSPPGLAAEDVWGGLLEGRWCVVDRWGVEGRRYLAAKRRAQPVKLTPREREVVVMASRGASNKVIAIELGVAVGSVSAYLASAMRKIGLRARGDLVALARLAGAGA